MYVLQVLLMIINVIIIIWNYVNLYKLHKINKEIEQEMNIVNEFHDIPSENNINLLQESGDVDKKS